MALIYITVAVLLLKQIKTQSELVTTNTDLEQALNAVLDAQKAGASVAALINQLNVASNLLAQAENAYRTGDINTAVNDADAALPIAQQVTTAAQTAQESASASAQTVFWTTVAFTVEDAIVFVLVLFLVWRWFKRS